MLTFNLNGVELKLSNGTMDEICNILQNFTSEDLYLEIETGKLLDFKDLVFGNGKLVEINNGFLLEDKETKRRIKIFRKELLEKLVESVTIYRMFTGVIGFDDIDEILYINRKIIKILDEKNHINLVESIRLSFSEFLELKGFPNAKIVLDFFEGNFGEIKIITTNPLPEDIIREIEEEAVLELSENNIVFFVYREN